MRSVEIWGQVTGPQTTPVEDLKQGLQRLREEDLESLAASSMAADMSALLQHMNACQAEFMRRMMRFENGGGYYGTGTFGTKSWLYYKCNLAYSAASDKFEVARQLGALPETTQAFADGDISYKHAALIARTAEKLGDKMDAQAESILVNAAKELDPLRLRRLTVQLRHQLDADSVLIDANEAHDSRFLSFSQTLDGVFYLNGRFDAEGGAILQSSQCSQRTTGAGRQAHTKTAARGCCSGAGASTARPG